MSNLSNKNWNIFWKIFLVALVLYVPVFLHLENLAIRLWDEARQANNAYEMYQHGHYLVTHFMGQPDMWNTKPPLLIWLQTLFFHLIGPGELAVRLPSALAAVGVAGLLMAFSVKYLRSYWFGFIAVLILITSQGFIDIHASRTGDYDMLLTFFTTAYALSIFLFFQTQSSKYLHFFFAALTLSILTKSIQGLLFLPAIGILFFIKKEHLQIFKNKWFYIDALLLLLLVGAYYLGREQLNPGYLQAVWDNELGGRYGSTLEHHEHGFFFYLKMLAYDHFKFWFWIIPLAIGALFYMRNKAFKHLIIFCLWMAVTYWLIISNSATKLEWYDVPAIPFLSLIAAYPIYLLFQLLRNASPTKFAFPNKIIPLLLLVYIFAYPYYEIYKKVHIGAPVHHDDQLYDISYYLRNAKQGKEKIKELDICSTYFNSPTNIQHIVFYANILKNQGFDINYVKVQKLTRGDKVIANEQAIKNYIEKHYNSTTLQRFHSAKIYRIHGKKQSATSH